MNYIDLFSGIGGFALALRWASIKCHYHFYSEIDNYANRVYQKNFPDAIALGDITRIDGNDLLKFGNNWIATAGFPCQDISVAGKGGGIDGEKSVLFFEAWRIIRDIRPKYVILENVPALTFRGLDRVLSEIAKTGYDAEWQVISASSVGAKHQRERIWIIAYPNSQRCKKQYISSESTGKRLNNRSHHEGRVIPDTLYDWAIERFRKLQKNKQTYQDGDNQRTRAEVDEIRQWWSTESKLDRVVNGIPNRVDRLRCLGNSIVPQVAYILFLRVLELINDQNNN